MAVTLKFTFPAGRYHATPWGRHVNEGVPEWPPSPWRLLRALVAVWKRTCPDLADEQVKRPLTALLGPPCFYLPPHRVAHTRHYMPWEKKGPADRTLVFDTFVSVSRSDALLVHWPDGELIADDFSLLGKLVGNLTTLGRAESWVYAELTNDTADWNCAPSEIAADPVPVFCPDPETALNSEYYPTHDPKKLAKGKVNFKEFLFDCPRWHLCLDTETIHDKKWPRVPGATWVNYARPPDGPTASMKRADGAASRPRPRPTIARFIVDAPVLPLVQDTLLVAEAMHRSLVWLYCNKTVARNRASHSRALAGKDESGRPLQGHEHAYYLPADEDGDGRIDHLTVTAAAGFGEGEVRALDLFRRLRWNEREPLRLMLTGLGNADDFCTPVFSPARAWVSATPFLATRHLKKRGTKRDPKELWDSPPDFVEAVAREELARFLQRRSDLATMDLQSLRIEPLLDEHDVFRSPLDRSAVRRLGAMSASGHAAFDCGPRALRPIQFKRFRRKPGDDGGRRPSGTFRIVFPEPVRGPLCLGHSSHFGLGLFLPE